MGIGSILMKKNSSREQFLSVSNLIYMKHCGQKTINLFSYNLILIFCFLLQKNHDITYSNSEIKEVISKVLTQFHIGDQRARIIVKPKKFIIYTTELNLDQKYMMVLQQLQFQPKVATLQLKQLTIRTV